MTDILIYLNRASASDRSVEKETVCSAYTPHYRFVFNRLFMNRKTIIVPFPLGEGIGRKYLFLLLFSIFSISLSAQTYQELSEKAVECVGKDSLAQAEDLLKQALRLEPKNPHNALLFSNLGLVQRKLGRYNDAVESYTYALNIAPLAVPILLNRAAIYLEQGMQDKAYVDYCQVMDVDKKNTEALLMRAYIYMLRRDYKGARLDYQRLLEIDPKNYNGRLGLATLEQKEGKFRESLDLLNQLLVEFPEDAVLYVARADVERDMKHEDLALVDLDEAIRLAPNSVDAYLLRGDIYLDQKKKSQAKADFEKAISLGVPPADVHEQMQQCK